MGLVCTILDFYLIIVFARAISSFFPISSGSPFLPVVDLLYKATEPVFAPVRRKLPVMAGFDFTPTVVVLGLFVIKSILGC